MRVKGKITVEVPALISPQHITMFTEGRIFEPRLTMLASHLPHLQSQCWHPTSRPSNHNVETQHRHTAIRQQQEGKVLLQKRRPL